MSVSGVSECDQNTPQQPTMHSWTDLCSFSSSPWPTTRMTFTQQQEYSGIGQDVLLHWETLFVILITDSDLHNLSTLHPEHQQLHLWPCTSYIKHNVCGPCLLPWVSDSWWLGSWRYSALSWHGQLPRRCQEKELPGDAGHGSNMLQKENLKTNKP